MKKNPTAFIASPFGLTVAALVIGSAALSSPVKATVPQAARSAVSCHLASAAAVARLDADPDPTVAHHYDPPFTSGNVAMDYDPTVAHHYDPPFTSGNVAMDYDPTVAHHYDPPFTSGNVAMDYDPDASVAHHYDPPLV